MGYESRIYIVKKTKHADFETGKLWAEILATFNMCNFSSLSDFMRKKPATNSYIYADDGNTKLIEDKYGEPLTEATVPATIKMLESAIASGDDYRRIFPLLAALKAVNEHKSDWPKVAVLHSGY